MTTTPESAVQSVLTDADKKRIYQVLAGMPYSGNIMKFAFHPKLPIDTVDDVVETLTALAETLTQVSKTHEETLQKLRDLEYTISGGRRLLKLLLAENED